MQKLSSTAQLQKVIIGLDSDIDIAVITANKKVKELAEKIADKIYLKTGKLVSLKFLSPKDFEKETSFIKEIKSGKIIK